MKGWSYHPLRAWRWVRIPVIIVALLAMLLYFLLWYLVNYDCEYERQTISPKQGDFDALVEEKWCGLIGSWCEVAVKLHRRTGWGLDTKIFVYYPASMDPGKSWTHDPVLAWLSANELEIAVDRLDEIHTQLAESHGVKIKYQIGFVDSQFARPLALEGEKVIWILKARLMDVPDDRTVDDTVSVLKDMVILDTYDVTGDGELMQLVDERVRGMTDSRIKEIAEQELDTMRERAAWAQALKKLRGELNK